MELYNNDCFEILPEIKDLSVDLVLVDLPYAQTACKWDCLIDLDKMWVELKRCCKRDCVYVFFCTTKFGYKLIQSNEKWFRYDLVWEKSRKVGFLSANKMPLRKHEMVYVFSDDGVDIDNSRNLGLRAYAKQVKEYINKNIKEIDKAVGNQGIHHFYSFTSTQFGLPTENTYNKLIEVYKLDKMQGFRTLEDLQNEWGHPTYNPQKTEGKPYKTGDITNSDNVYGITKKGRVVEGRHPTSILQIPETPDNQEQREHNMVYIFSDTNNDDLDNSRNLGLREYFKNVMEYIGKTLKQITNKVGRSAEHCFYINSTQFGLPTENTYNTLIEVYKLDKMEGFRTLEDLQKEWEKIREPTYNSQKTEGKPYKTNGRKDGDMVYGRVKGEPINNKGDRHPTSILQIPEAPEDQEERKHQMVYIFKEKQGTYNPQKEEGKPYKHSGKRSSNQLYGGGLSCSSEEKTDRHPTTIVKFNNPKKSLHRTQKPVELCEWLIKSYSNENDLVLDFTMGSGTTGEACKNTNRKFIGVEKDEEIFKIAFERLEK